MNRNSTFILVTALFLVGCGREQSPPPQHLVAETLERFGGTITFNEDSPTKSVIGVQLPALKTTDTQLELLRGLDQLQTLDVENSKVSDKGLRHLAELIELRSLDLHGTQITDEGLKHLNKLKNLQILDLSGTQVSDNGVEYLKNMSHLESLMLFDTKITEDGIIDLRKSFPEVDIIEASGNLAKDL